MSLLSRHPNDCPSTQIYHDGSYVLEVYAWTVLGILAFVARYIVRLRILPWRKLQGDDWMGLGVLLFFIGLTGCKLAVYHLGTNSDYTEEAIKALSQCQVKRIELGSKFQVSGWFFYACFLWGLKGMVLFLFSRLSLPPYQHHLLKVLAVVSILTYIAVMLVVTCGCRPFSRNWATLPYPPSKCTSRIQNFYTASILNILTDAAILSIALPVLWSLRVPLARKIALCLLLCSGIFVISAAVVTVLMSLLDAHSTLNTNRWATREEIAGILAVNAPTTKPMFHWTFWRRDFTSFRATRPQRPMRRQRVVTVPPSIDPIRVADRPQASAVGRLGVLSSLKSSIFTGSSTRDGSTKGTADYCRQTAVCESGKAMMEMEASWGVRGDDVDVVAYPPVAMAGPKSLPPEPTKSWSARGDSIPCLELQAINEEEAGRCPVHNEKVADDH